MTMIEEQHADMPGGSKKIITRQKFTPDEDEEICRLVKELGASDWNAIATAMGTDRTKRQLRERWMNYLDPHLDLGYTAAEDALLVDLVRQRGPQWAKIAATIGTKSAISTRNRYRSLKSMEAKGVEPIYGSPVAKTTAQQKALAFDDLDFDLMFFAARETIFGVDFCLD
jgi:hypothetical protein